MTMSVRLTTLLFVPGDRPERFAKAAASGADAVILDLEDAVRPDAKAAARANIVRHGLARERTVVRINDAASPWWRDDARAVADAGVGYLMLPKTESPESIAELRERVGPDLRIIPQIESALGLCRVDAILAAPGVERVAFGHLDFAADIGCATDGEPLAYARSRLIVRSRAAGRPAPLDSVTADIGSPETLRRDAEAARRSGFGGKLLIHPNQVAIVREAFAPTGAELAWARKVIDAAAGTASGAVMVDGKMIDRPVVEAARRLLELASATGAGA